ncbi:MAG: TetR/AcrR family transcriptional regulator [Chloroflexi bacterium]|nr:TetR/AcrR family transcriptional regulator [Chloroflexota bacterium]
MNHDRRSQRTRQAITDALIELMVDQTYNTITVQEIIDRANVGRSTFYSHYADKDALLSSVFEQFGKELELTSTRAYQLLPIRELFEHVAENHRQFKAFLWGSGTDFLFRAVHGHLDIHFEKRLQEKLGEEKPPVLVKMVAHHITGVLMTLIQWWLDEKKPFTPEEMDTYFHQLVVPGVEQMFGIRL